MHATSSQSFIPQTKIKLILTEKHLKDEMVNANERGPSSLLIAERLISGGKWGRGKKHRDGWDKKVIFINMLIFQEQRMMVTGSGCSKTPIRAVNCISASKAGTLILFAFI